MNADFDLIWTTSLSSNSFCFLAEKSKIYTMQILFLFLIIKMIFIIIILLSFQNWLIIRYEFYRISFIAFPSVSKFSTYPFKVGASLRKKSHFARNDGSCLCSQATRNYLDPWLSEMASFILNIRTDLPIFSLIREPSSYMYLFIHCSKMF